MVVSVPNTDATEPTCPTCARPTETIDLPRGGECEWCPSCEARYYPEGEAC